MAPLVQTERGRGEPSVALDRAGFTVFQDITLLAVGPASERCRSAAIRMSRDDAIQAAIAHFTDWKSPWTFYDVVMGSLCIDDKPRFEAIWQEAMRVEHWNSASLAKCARNAADAVAQKFPFLERSLVDAVANAASYQWK